MGENLYETKSKDLFNSYLCNKLEDNYIKWEKVKDGEDPPDYWLTLYGEKRYAVEVTSSKIKSDNLLGKEKVEQKTFIKSIQNYIEDIENKTKTQDILKGTYIISFRKPFQLKKKYKRILSQKIICYIIKTSHLDKTNYDRILIKNLEICNIYKVNNQNKSIYPVYVTLEWADAPENDEQILQMLQHAIDDKKEKLREITEPKILLYYDTYLLCTSTNYLRCADRLKNLESFDSIYVNIDGSKVINVYESENIVEVTNV